MLKRIILLTFLFANILSAMTISSQKDLYNSNEKINIIFTQMEEQNQDWIGIYHKNSNNEWKNVINWAWTNDVADGNIEFNRLPVGEYEARAFYNNSFTLEGKVAFEVSNNGALNTTVTSNKDIYTTEEAIVASYDKMSGDNQDWIAIYPKDSSTSWGNMIQWAWVPGTIKGTHTFKKLPVGEYEVRVFFNNSGTLEASHAFQVVKAEAKPATVTTDKESYTTEENILSTFTNMSGDDEDWIAIYPAGSSNAWANCIQAKWTNAQENGTQTFNPLPVGEYEVRLFFNNSYDLEASHKFSVKETAFLLKSRKDTYNPIELIHADFDNMRGTASDWIGIFHLNAPHSKENAIDWKYAKSQVKGELSFNGLPAGTYEMRAYFATKHKKTLTFTVRNTAPVVIMYEDAEDGIDPRWVHYAGRYPIQLLNGGAKGSAHSIRHRGYWENGSNPSGYYFPFGNVEKKMKFLELDMRIGISSHLFNFGVTIDTKDGSRRIIFASWMNHPGNNMSGHAVWRKPFHTSNGYILMNPGPTDYYLATRNGHFTHYKINIEKTLRILEPDNELLKITGFTTSGGDYDNLSLVSH